MNAGAARIPALNGGNYATNISNVSPPTFVFFGRLSRDESRFSGRIAGAGRMNCVRPASMIAC
ncbi:hypothetical protein [Micromonospora sp. NBC_00421]|uniref:hypothetical protein n=1 Tax=Micromonospora sp. NBC_00421 TaxID=2975976 RepID=UPI002E20AA1C